MPTKKTFAPRLLAAGLLFAFACLTPVSCLRETQQPPPAPRNELSRERVVGARGGAITYRVMTPPKTLNPLMVSDEASFTVAFHLLNARLIDFDHDRQAYAPALAESWRLLEDGRTVEVVLRDGLKFSDGQPLTAADVAFTLRAIYDEKTGSIFRTSMTVNERQIEARPADARRMQLAFPEPVAAPETYLVNMFVLPRHVLEEDLKRGTLGSEAYGIASDPARVVTAGPFVPESVVAGERVTLKRNPNYWKKDSAGNQLPYLDRLVAETVSDPNAAVARLTSGALDCVDRVRAGDYAALRGGSGGEGGAPVRAYDLGPGLGTDYIVFNQNPVGKGGGGPDASKRAWFADERFRRAVAHAVDRESIASSTLQGLATPLYGVVSPGNRQWAAGDLPRAAYDLERARALLGEAGFNARGGGDAPEMFDPQGRRVEFTMLVAATNEERKAMAAVIQEDLGKLGIKAQVAPVETGELMRRVLQSHDYDAAILGLIVSDLDPSSYSNFLKSSSENHQWAPRQPRPATEWEARIDELVAALSREAVPERRREVFREIQLIIAERMPVVPVVARHVAVAANTRLGNYRPSSIVPYSMWNADELFVKQ